MKICISLLQRHAVNNLEMQALLQRRAQNCMRHVSWSPQQLAAYNFFLTSAKFWMSDDHEMTKGLLSNVETLCFTTVFDVRRGHEERVAQTTCPRRKKRKRFWRGEDFSKSSLPQQPSSAPFSAGFLTRHPQQPSSAAVLKLLVILLWSVVGGQLLVNHWTSIWGGHGLVVGYFSTIEHQLLVVNFLWSSMNEFLERSLWQRFRARRVSALNPKQSCRRVGWNMKTFLFLLVSGLAQPTPLESKPLSFQLCNWTWIAVQTNWNQFVAHSRKQRKKQSANTFWTVAPAVSNGFWDCLLARVGLAGQWSIGTADFENQSTATTTK